MIDSIGAAQNNSLQDYGAPPAGIPGGAVSLLSLQWSIITQDAGMTSGVIRDTHANGGGLIADRGARASNLTAFTLFGVDGNINGHLLQPGRTIYFWVGDMSGPDANVDFLTLASQFQPSFLIFSAPYIGAPKTDIYSAVIPESFKTGLSVSVQMGGFSGSVTNSVRLSPWVL